MPPYYAIVSLLGVGVKIHYPQMMLTTNSNRVFGYF